MAREDEEQRDLAGELLARLEERGAGEGLVLRDLLQVERDLVDALRLVRQQIDAIARRDSDF